MLKIDNLTKIYGEKKAVDNVSIHIQPGEIYGFIGHNGAGKTTTIKCVVGILGMDQGTITINGHSMVIQLRMSQLNVREKLLIFQITQIFMNT